MTTDKAWSAIETMPDVSTACREPSLALIGDFPHAIWTQDKVIYHGMRSSSGWQQTTRVAVGEQPTLASTADGQLHCLYTNEFAGNYEIYHVSWDGSQWSFSRNVSRTSGASTQPCLAAGADGTLHAVWADTTPGHSVIYYARRKGNYWTCQPIPGATGSSPALALTSSGRIFVAWQDRLAGSDRYEIFSISCQADIWEMVDQVSANPAMHSVSPMLATDSLGGCHIVWQEESDSRYHIRYATRSTGAWSTPLQISESGADCRLARLTVNRQGFPEIVWQEGNSIRHRVRPPDINSEWLSTELVATAPLGIADLRLTVTRAGVVHVIWCGYATAQDRRLFYATRSPVFKQTQYFPVG